VRQRWNHAVECNLHLAADEIRRCRRAAFVRYVHHIDAGSAFEEFHGEMRH
jgi:hypothetical protein